MAEQEKRAMLEHGVRILRCVRDEFEYTSPTWATLVEAERIFRGIYYADFGKAMPEKP